ncbi:MAG: hypothetical protein Q7J27_07985 [Syntrophales bacterium]|nr:hypothetical protein [Syntrophales bacterium]
MKLLSIENNMGLYLGESGQYSPVDKITKEDLLRLVNLTLQEDVEFDVYDDNAIKNQAQQIVYKSVFEKLRGLKDRKKEFVDESERLYLKEYERYREDSLKKRV